MPGGVAAGRLEPADPDAEGATRTPSLPQDAHRVNGVCDRAGGRLAAGYADIRQKIPWLGDRTLSFRFFRAHKTHVFRHGWESRLEEIDHTVIAGDILLDPGVLFAENHQIVRARSTSARHQNAVSTQKGTGFGNLLRAGIFL